MRSFEAEKIVSRVLVTAIGLTCLTGCQTAVETRTDCVVVQPLSVGAVSLTGTMGVFPKTLEKGYGVSLHDYQTNFTGDAETRGALTDKLKKDASGAFIQLGASDVLAFCVTFQNKKDFGKGGKLWPYSPPTNGPIATKAVTKVGGEPKFYKDAQKKFPGTKIFVVTDNQTELEPLAV